jgi:hypothetical protein
MNVIPLGKWDIELQDLTILENEIRTNPVVADYFSPSQDYGMNFMEPEPPEEVKDVYRRVNATQRTVNILNIGIKSILNLKQMIKNNRNFVVEEGIKELMKSGLDFYKVTLIADFRSDKKWKFTKATINVTSNSPVAKNGYPKIYSIAPERIEEKTKKTRKFGLAPSLKLFEQELDPGASLEYSEEYESVTQLIVGHFFATQQAWWDFITGNSIREIEGIQKLELIIVQSTKSRSLWRIMPNATLTWEGLINRFASKLIRRKPELPNTLEVSFNVP